MTLATTYAAFAAREAHGVSPVYERLSAAVSGDDKVLALLGTLPPNSGSRIYCSVSYGFSEAWSRIQMRSTTTR